MTLGTTSSCGLDPVDELGPICQSENVWVHIDSAYAGNHFNVENKKYVRKRHVCMVYEEKFSQTMTLLIFTITSAIIIIIIIGHHFHSGL